VLSFAVDASPSDSLSPVLLVTALIGAISASLVILGALRAWYLRTIGRRRDRYRRLARLGTGAQVPFFSSVLGEPPAVQYTVEKDDYMVLLDREDPGWDPEKFQTKPVPRDFKVSIFIDRDYYVQAIADDDQTVLAYSVTTRSRRFRPSIRPVPPLSLRQRVLRRRDWMMPRRQPRIVLGRTRFADLDATEPDEFAPPRLRLRLGAHNFDYTETAYYGNPGRYQSFAWSASDVARQGPTGNIAKACTGFPQIDPDEWSRIGSSDEWPDWSDLPELQRFRRDTAITTYTVCDVKLAIENYPLGRFGVGEHEVRTLWRRR
jgi:hypothetical protein